MLRLILILSLITSTSWAQCPDDIQVINKGQVANCDGLLFSNKASKKADEALEDAKYYKSLSEKLQIRQDYTSKEVNLLEQRLQLHMNQSQTLAEELARQKTEDKWQKLIYFSLGVVATGIAVYGASKLTD